METKELKITIPEGQEIDWRESAKQEKIVFKKKDDKPRSWGEYYEQQIANKKHGYYIDDADCSSVSVVWNELAGANKWRNVLPSKELTEAFLAMMQLMSLRQAWIGDWEPDYYMNMASNWCIEYEPNPGVFSIENHCKTNGGGLTFPTREMTKDFMNCFKDLLEIAKPLI